MIHFRKARIGKAKGFLAFLQKLTGQKSPLEEIEKRVDSYEKRNTIRIYVELPVSLVMKLVNGREEMFQGQSANISEKGILINFWTKAAFWKQLEAHLDIISMNYRFIYPKEIAGGEIQGSARHHIKKIGGKKNLVELEIGIENDSMPDADRLKISHYIKKHVLKSINEDIEEIEKIKKQRELSPVEIKLHQSLLHERSFRSGDLETKPEEE